MFTFTEICPRNCLLIKLRAIIIQSWQNLTFYEVCMNSPNHCIIDLLRLLIKEQKSKNSKDHVQRDQKKSQFLENFSLNLFDYQIIKNRIYSEWMKVILSMHHFQSRLYSNLSNMKLFLSKIAFNEFLLLILNERIM